MRTFAETSSSGSDNTVVAFNSCSVGSRTSFHLPEITCSEKVSKAAKRVCDHRRRAPEDAWEWCVRSFQKFSLGVKSQIFGKIRKTTAGLNGDDGDLVMVCQTDQLLAIKHQRLARGDA